MQLDLPMMQQTPKKIGGRDCKTTLHKRSEQNNFVCTFIWAVFTVSWAPLNNGPSLENSIFNQWVDLIFRKFAFLPPNHQSFDFALGFFGCHTESRRLYVTRATNCHFVARACWATLLSIRGLILFRLPLTHNPTTEHLLLYQVWIR